MRQATVPVQAPQHPLPLSGVALDADGDAVKRGRPLKRKTWMKRRRSTPRRSSRVYDQEYLRWIRHQPCCAKVHGGRCGGRVEADHTGRRGVGQKADDRSAVSLCHNHHVWRTNFAGPFKEWDQMRMREWLANEVIRHNHEYTMKERNG